MLPPDILRTILCLCSGSTLVNALCISSLKRTVTALDVTKGHARRCVHEIRLILASETEATAKKIHIDLSYPDNGLQFETPIALCLRSYFDGVPSTAQTQFIAELLSCLNFKDRATSRMLQRYTCPCQCTNAQTLLVAAAEEHGTDSAGDSHDCTYIETYFACRLAHLDTLRILIIAVQLTIRRGHAKVLIPYKAIARAEIDKAIQDASSKGRLDCLRHLVAHGADIHVDHAAALRIAIQCEQATTVEYLIDRGASVRNALTMASPEMIAWVTTTFPNMSWRVD